MHGGPFPPLDPARPCPPTCPPSPARPAIPSTRAMLGGLSQLAGQHPTTSVLFFVFPGMNHGPGFRLLCFAFYALITNPAPKSKSPLQTSQCRCPVSFIFPLNPFQDPLASSGHEGSGVHAWCLAGSLACGAHPEPFPSLPRKALSAVAVCLEPPPRFDRACLPVTSLEGLERQIWGAYLKTFLLHSPLPEYRVQD